YSTDGGKTWDKHTPTSKSALAANLPQSGTEVTAQVKQENGVNLYSTDGGKTWDKHTPTTKDQAVKIVSMKDGIAQFEAVNEADLKNAESSMQIMIKQENGVTLYSTDKGKTWSEKAPNKN
ncbi:WD40/YVTN/BNR-like repeat-containing protein, partial [Lysinibacillus sphaericus]